jgi:methyl-accepting chemotaxis protein
MRADFDAIKQALLQANGAIREASRTIGQGLDGTRDNLAAAKEAARGLEQLGETAAGLDFRLKGFSEALGDSAAARADEMKRASKQMVAAAGQVVGEADRVAEALIRGTRGIADAVRDAGRISGSPQ